MLRKFALALVVLALGAANASAVQINGSMSVGAFGATINDGTNIGNTTSLNVVVPFAGLATGDYTNVTVGTFATASVIDLTNLPAFSITFGTFGTFQAAASVGMLTTQITQQTATNLDIFFVGSYSGLLAFDPTPTSFRVSFTQSGESISFSATLNSPPVPPRVVPEPTTVASAVAGLLFAGFAARRRLAK
ncbi:MAG: hypothetical protein SFX72_08025 [Isosphaeraceae bacterium]|nr:hypothetical protein [Isosphaeraceae bacterium]